MSIKKFGQGGEYLHFSVKKKFYSLVFFDNKNVFDFAGFLHRNFIKSKSNLSYIIRTIFLLSITTLLFLFVITITLCKKNSLLFYHLSSCNLYTQLYDSHVPGICKHRLGATVCPGQ
jgi:hypothetical protein